jgi:hypothetical protein
MGLKETYAKVKEWKERRAEAGERKAEQQLAKMEKQVAVEERRAKVYTQLASAKARISKARGQTSGVSRFGRSLSNVNQKFQNVDKQFGMIGNTIMGTPRGRSSGGGGFKTIRTKGYIHPVDRMFGIQGRTTTRRVKVKQKVQPIQIQITQITKAKKRKIKPRIVYNPLFGYVRQK